MPKLYLCPILVGLLSIVGAVDNNCVSDDYNLTPLANTIWEARPALDSPRPTDVFFLHLCSAVTPPDFKCSSNTSVCMVGSDGRGVNIGWSSEIKRNDVTRELNMKLEGDKCASSENLTKTIVTFRCGKTLGSPTWTQGDPCNTYFEWETSAACKNFPVVPETKCYVYDGKGVKIDLQPLILSSGSYTVQDDGSDDDDDTDHKMSSGVIQINVCRELKKDGASLCGGGAACLVSNSTVYNLGLPDPSSALTQSQSGELSLNYRTNTSFEGCSTGASTTVIFKCAAFGKSRPPRLLSKADCHYLIEWSTEAACSRELVSSVSCKHVDTERGINIDLTPLIGNQSYIMNYTEKGQLKYTYTLNLCGQYVNCGDQSQVKASSCQALADGKFKVLGLADQQELRYLDDHLTLTFKEGDPCSTDLKRNTVIDFHCNSSAGIGAPVFSREDSCTYVFMWETLLACNVSAASPTSSGCQVVDSGRVYDLSHLIRDDGTDDWRVDGLDQSSSMVINVCRSLTRSESSTKSCSSGSALCLIADGKATSLGGFSSPPMLDTNSQSIILSYESGDKCRNNLSYSSNITFRCSPGMTDTQPRLISYNSTTCHYELSWYTAYACVRSHTEGQNCQIKDRNTGYTFDLRPLMKTSSMAYYNVTSSTEHSYFINVCYKVSGTPCDGRNDVGVCQQDNSSPLKVFSGGNSTNSTLHYYDGVLKLVYSGGDPYNTIPPIPRRSEIIFLCDDKVGVGIPRFINESDHSYRFLWYTSYACAPASVDCTVKDQKTGQLYDLNGLSHSGAAGNWIAELVMDDGSRKRFYINVCRPVVPFQLISSSDVVTCGPNAGACASVVNNGKETLVDRNLGQLSGGPTIHDGSIALDYVNGDLCGNSSAVKYSMRLLLTCDRNGRNEGPSMVTRSSECAYVIMWHTSHACARNASIVGGSCSVTDSLSGYTYDMSALKATNEKGFYSVKVSQRESWKINICGSVTACGEDVAVCEENGRAVATLSNSQMKLVNKQPQLIYTGPKESVILRFICDHPERSTAGIEPMFVDYKLLDGAGTTYYFDVKTPLACPATSVDCHAFDSSGRKYDLLPLQRSGNGSWSVSDGKIKYLFNVCSPMRSTADGDICPGGPVGGCQITPDGRYSVGYPIQPPTVTEGGEVTILYTEGDVCHNGTTRQARRSMRIIFSCANMQRDPIFQEETDSCEYIIQWSTPFACPLRKEVGDNCSVKDPLYHMDYDLSSLNNTSSYRVDNFTLNICGALPTSSMQGGCVGATVGACQHVNNTWINIGNFNKQLEYEEGELQLHYKSDANACGGNRSYETIISFTCVQGAANSGMDNALKYLSARSKSTPCQYWFQYETPLACASFSVAECSVTDDKGLTYDLSGLTLTGDNYEAEGTNSVTRYFINVCTPLVHSSGVTCPPNSAACIEHRNVTDVSKRFESIGRLGEKVLNITEGELKLTYRGGAPCSENRESQTIIRFVCFQSIPTGRPSYLSTSSDCVHTFIWLTRQACPRNSTSESTTGNCSAVDPAGNVYSMLPLKRQYTVTDTDEHTYNISICSPLVGSRCGANSGSCQISRRDGSEFNAGNANSALVYLSGALSLTYTGGKICHHNNRSRTTVINFYCPSASNNRTQGELQFVAEDDQCTYFVSMQTELACPRMLQCRVHTSDGDVDLSSLIKDGVVYTASVSQSDDLSEYMKDEFYVSVCRTVVSMSQLTSITSACSSDAAVCRRAQDGKFMSLGRLSSEPSYNASVAGSVILSYTNGDRCTEDGNNEKYWSSEIKFICSDDITRGSPALVSVENCVYRFEWKTKLVCQPGLAAPSITTAPTTTSLPTGGGEDNRTSQACQFIDELQGNMYNLSTLSTSSKDIGVASKSNSDMYHFAICGFKSEGPCKSQTFCRVNGKTVVWSTDNKPSVKYEGQNIKLVYEGIQCPSKSRSGMAVILMYCDLNAPESNQPSLVQEDANDCSTVLRWNTPYACAQTVADSCSVTSEDTFVDLSKISSTWVASDESNNSYLVSLCHGLPYRRDWPGCQGSVSACYKSSSSAKPEPLAYISSQKLITSKVSGSPDAVVAKFSDIKDLKSCSVSIRMICPTAELDKSLGVNAADKLRLSNRTVSETNCLKQFDLVTTRVCHDLRSPDNPVTGSEGKGSDVAIAMIVLLICTVIIVLVIVLRPAHRRTAIRNRLRKIFEKGNRADYLYSNISDEDTGEGSSLLSRQHSPPGNIQSYESDDDLLL